LDELRRQKELLRDVSNASFENTPFTPDERDEITEQLHELKEYVTATYSLVEAQSIDLDYLVDAADRLGRKDWLMVCLGVMFSYILGATLPPEACRDIVQTLLNSLAHFFEHGSHRLNV
jgi:hypothetical protein